jgi:hypothetical protein
MASGASLQAIGNWDKEVGVGLSTALSVAMDISGKTGEKACRQALVFMAQSASSPRHNVTGASKKNRPTKRDEHGPYVENYRRGHTGFQKLYKWMFEDDNANRQEGMIPGSFKNARVIGNRGLARRSWMWGLSRLGGKSKGAAIRGTYRVSSLRGETVNGYLKENKLDYIIKALKPGWERMVERLASNRIMAQARNKLESKWRRRVGARKGVKPSAKALSTYFLANP